VCQHASDVEYDIAQGVVQDANPTDAQHQQPRPNQVKGLRPIPFVSCLYPTYRRPQIMANTIPCFITNDYPADRRELIILDDAGELKKETSDGWQIISISRRFRSLPEKFNALAGLIALHQNLWVTCGWEQRFRHLHFQCFGGQHSTARSPTSTSTATSGGNSQLRRNRSSSFGCRMAYGPSLCCQARPECSRRFRGIPKQYEKQNVPFCAAYRPRTTSIPARTAAMCLWGSRPISGCWSAERRQWSRSDFD
jgi:hypothetical protein